MGSRVASEKADATFVIPAKAGTQRWCEAAVAACQLPLAISDQLGSRVRGNDAYASIASSSTSGPNPNQHRWLDGTVDVQESHHRHLHGARWWLRERCSPPDGATAIKQLPDLAQAQSLALAIVDTLPEPFLVLDEHLRLLAGSRCFYEVFDEDPIEAHGRSLFELSGGQWDIAGLRQLLTAVVPDHAPLEAFEFEKHFAGQGLRTMQLNALPIRDDGSRGRMVLLAIKDITDRRVAEQEKQRLLEHTEELLEQQKTLLREMQHRIGNSLQIIASILLLKAGSVSSEETKNELRAAHQRVMSVAAVQSHLQESDGIERIEMGPYLRKLSGGLVSSMVDRPQDVAINVKASAGALPSSDAVSIGLIVTELIINAIKYAFPEHRASAQIRVTFEMARLDWKLTVSDNGTGRRQADVKSESTGLGTVLVAALAKQLKAQIVEKSSTKGLGIAITRATFQPTPKGSAMAPA